MQKEWKTYFEWMRIIAVGLVIFNHSPGYTLYMISDGPKQKLYMFLTMITRINVPLFLMVSGALLLSKEEEYITVVKKRISRFILVIMVFTAGLYLEYYLYTLYKGNEFEFTISHFIYGTLARNLEGTGSYWYLYSYLGFLFTLPFMRRIAKEMNKQDFWMLILLHFVFSSMIPLINIALSMLNQPGISVSGDFSVPFATVKVFFYPLLGYYLEHNINVKTIKRESWCGIAFATLIGIVLSCLCTFIDGKMNGSYSQSYVQLFDYVTTVAAFIFIKRAVTVSIPALKCKKVRGGVRAIGSLTFGMYLLDPYLKLTFEEKYNRLMEPYFPTLIVSIGWCLFSMIFGGFVTYMIKRLQFFRKLI